MLYNAVKYIIRAFFVLYLNVELKGFEKIPENEGILLCPNHISNYDPFLVASMMDRKVSFMAKYEAFKNPLLGWFLGICHAYPVKRGEADIGAIKKTLNLLKSDEVVGLFPEGTRVRTGDIGKVHPGMGMFAVKSDKKVVPVAISGKYGFRKKVRIAIGDPIDLSEYKKPKMTNEDYTYLSEMVMKKIEKMLKEE